MDGLYDYIRWMGDYPFSATGFHTPDALVLCALSYIDFSPVFHEGMTLQECQALLDEGNVSVKIVGRTADYVRLLEAAVRSRRFGALALEDYMDRLSGEVQFSALVFRDPEGPAFLAFRGTDHSLAGWREDFLISCTRTQAQLLAADYAIRHLVQGGRWYLGGHSKGANLALFAACTLPEAQREQLEHLFLLDGPGLCSEVMGYEAPAWLDPLSTRVLPGYSVFGRLFPTPCRDTRIVRSGAFGIAQHGVATWGISYGKLALLPAHDPQSDLLSDILNRWIEGISPEDRALFVRELFDALSAGGAVTLDDLIGDGYRGFEQIRPRFQAMSDTSKRILTDLRRQALLSGVDALRLPFLG